MESLCNVMRNYGITTKEMCNAVSRLPKTPFSEMDIDLIRNNPSLSWFQKWKLTREVKKNMAIDSLFHWQNKVDFRTLNT